MDVWRHKTRGTTYEVLTHDASLQCASERSVESMFEDENWTVYRSTLTGAVYVRLTEEFRDGRFEQLPDTTDSTDLPPLDDSRLSSKSEIADAANEMYATLLLLSGPRDAAKAIALTHLLVIEADDTKSEETVRAKMKEVTDFVIENWHGAARGHG